MLSKLKLIKIELNCKQLIGNDSNLVVSLKFEFLIKNRLKTFALARNQNKTRGARSVRCNLLVLYYFLFDSPASGSEK